MEHYLPYLHWIDHQKAQMKELVIKWANINTHATNYAGLDEQMQEIKKSFESLEGVMHELTLLPHTIVDEHGKKITMPLGKALQVTKRPEAPIKILLAGHMDTVFGKSSAFQKVIEDEKHLLGPGVTDMKGGLVILLTALQALEKSPYAKNIGWEVIINPDEEIGSPGSHSLFERAAKRNHLGLLFEPAHADGAIVTTRAGSMKLVLTVKGKSAHAGRDFAQGRSAIYALAPLLVELEKLSTLQEGQDENLDAFNDQVIINVGELRSGAGFNVVPDLAILRINVRSAKQELLEKTKTAIRELVHKYGAKEGITMELTEEGRNPPKIVDDQTAKIINWISACGKDLQIQIKGKPSRGSCDGSYLASCGLPCVDTLGAVGNHIHTHSEYVEIDSLPARAKLTALLLMRLGAGDYQIEAPQSVISL